MRTSCVRLCSIGGDFYGGRVNGKNLGHHFSFSVPRFMDSLLYKGLINY